MPYRCVVDVVMGEDGQACYYYSDGSTKPIHTQVDTGIRGLTALGVVYEEMAYSGIAEFSTAPLRLSRPATSPAARARKTLRDLLGRWRYLRYIHQGCVTTRGPSGRIWRLQPSGKHYFWCSNGHNIGVCQAYTGLGENLPGEDRVATALLYLRSGIEDERELIAKGGVTTIPRYADCADCAEALGRRMKTADVQRQVNRAESERLNTPTISFSATYSIG